MPIYEYRCAKCSHEFEVMRLSRSGFADVKCPACGNSEIERKFSVFAPSVKSANNLPCGTGECDMPSPGCHGGMCGLT